MSQIGLYWHIQPIEALSQLIHSHMIMSLVVHTTKGICKFHEEIPSATRSTAMLRCLPYT